MCPYTFTRSGIYRTHHTSGGWGGGYESDVQTIQVPALPTGYDSDGEQKHEQGCTLLEIPHGRRSQITSTRDVGGTRMRATKQAPVNANKLYGVLEFTLEELHRSALWNEEILALEFINRLYPHGQRIGDTLWEIKRLHHKKVRTECGRVIVDTSIVNLRSTGS